MSGAVVSLESLVEAIVSLNLVEAAELVKMLEEKIGLPIGSFAMGAAAAPEGAAGGGVLEAKTEYEVVLNEIDPTKKISVIKAVREINSELGLKEAKEFVESLPAVLVSKVTKERAEEIKQKLVAAGVVKIDVK